jgi:hypothetical protein
MKDVTSTSFGLVIAFLLPGLSALACLPFWSADSKSLLQEFVKAPNNVGLFLLVLLAGLACGLQVSVLRWVLFEKILCRKHKLDLHKFQNLKEEKLEAFRAAADEHYRYHQFWGGTAIVLPVFFFSLLKSQTGTSSLVYYFWDSLWGNLASPPISLEQFILESSFFVFMEILTIWAACAAFRFYINRGTAILSK